MNGKSVTCEEKGKGYSQLPPFVGKYLKIYTDNKGSYGLQQVLHIYKLLKKRIVKAVVILNYRCKASLPRCYQKSFSEKV